jgi:hypothetical protein
MFAVQSLQRLFSPNMFSSEVVISRELFGARCLAEDGTRDSGRHGLCEVSTALR